MTTNHPLLKGQDPLGVPVWPLLRNIDGYYYLRQSVHPTEADAKARVAEIRAAGGSAQSFASGAAKFETTKDGLNWHGHPGRAAVYSRPEGKDVQLDGDSYALAERPQRARKEPKPKKAKKDKPAKKAKKAEVPVKEKIKARLARKDTPAVAKAKAKLAAQAEPAAAQ